MQFDPKDFSVPASSHTSDESSTFQMQLEHNADVWQGWGLVVAIAFQG